MKRTPRVVIDRRYGDKALCSRACKPIPSTSDSRSSEPVTNSSARNAPLLPSLGFGRPARQRADYVADRHAAGAAPPKQARHASERDTLRVQEARAAYRQELAQLDPRRFKCIDASGGNLAMTRLFGRAPRGARVSGAIPQNYGAHVTRLAALGHRGIAAVMTLDGATDAEVFRADVEQVLCPTLRASDLVVRAHVRAHKTAAIREAIEQRGAPLIYLLPSSPDLSPIKRCWSKRKTYWRTAKARTRGALDTALAQALATVTQADARGWFAHAGYALQ
jgi:transposase